MKKLTKVMLATDGVLLLGAGAVTSYLMVQPEQRMSDLTLANLEAMVFLDPAAEILTNCSEIPCR